MPMNTEKSMEWREAIEFLLELTKIEGPEKLRPGDRLNLMDDLRRYIEDDGTGRLADELKEADEKPAKLKPIIEVIRKIAEAAADHKMVEHVCDQKLTITFEGDRLGTERGAVSWDGSLENVMADTAANDFDELRPWQMCRCPECKQVFLAKRKGQIYCSHAHASAASERNFREKRAKDHAKRVYGSAKRSPSKE